MASVGADDEAPHALCGLDLTVQATGSFYISLAPKKSIAPENRASAVTRDFWVIPIRSHGDALGLLSKVF